MRGGGLFGRYYFCRGDFAMGWWEMKGREELSQHIAESDVVCPSRGGSH